MITVNNLNNSARQKTQVALSDGSLVLLTLNYRPAVQRWFVDVAYKNAFGLNGVGVSIHPNMLRTFRSVVPFGLAVTAVDGVDPFDINDFANGRVIMYVLDNTDTKTDVTDVETNIFGG